MLPYSSSLSSLNFWIANTSLLSQEKLLKAVLWWLLWASSRTTCCCKSRARALSLSKITNQTELEDTAIAKSRDMITVCLQDRRYRIQHEHSHGCLYHIAELSSHATALLISTKVLFFISLCLHIQGFNLLMAQSTATSQLRTNNAIIVAEITPQSCNRKMHIPKLVLDSKRWGGEQI